MFQLFINQCQLSSSIILDPCFVIDRCLSQCFSHCLVLSCVHALCLVLLVLVLFVVLHVFIACSLHVLDVCTRGNKDFVFRISYFAVLGSPLKYTQRNIYTAGLFCFVLCSSVLARFRGPMHQQNNTPDDYI